MFGKSIKTFSAKQIYLNGAKNTIIEEIGEKENICELIILGLGNIKRIIKRRVLQKIYNIANSMTPGNCNSLCTIVRQCRNHSGGHLLVSIHVITCCIIANWYHSVLPMFATHCDILHIQYYCHLLYVLY